MNTGRILCEPFGQLRTDSFDDSVFVLQPSSGATALMSSRLGDEIACGMLSQELSSELMRRNFVDTSTGVSPVMPNIEPVFFMVDLTGACNNRCDYCFRSEHTNRFVDEQTLRRIVSSIVAYCRKAGLSKISFQPWGGEPLLAWSRIVLICDLFRDAGIDVRMLVETNGVSVTPRIAREMFDRGILCSVSIDGPALIHDRCRHLTAGSGSHAEAIRGFERLRDAGYGHKVGVVCVVTRNSVSHVRDLVEYFSRELHLSRLKMNVVRDSPALKDKTLCLSDEQTRSFWVELLRELIRINCAGISFGENTILSMLHNMTTHRLLSFCHSRGCQAGYRMLSFSMQGGVFPCDMVDCDAMRLGWASDQADLVAMVRDSARGHEFFMRSVSVRCQACDWRVFCVGGCRAMCLQSGMSHSSSDCLRNETLYPLLIDLIVSRPELVLSISNGEISIT